MGRLEVNTPTILAMTELRSAEERLSGLAHLRYELSTMMEAARRLEGITSEPSFERNVLVEVTLLHARNLIEFLGDKKKEREEMSPDDFASDWDYSLGQELI